MIETSVFPSFARTGNGISLNTKYWYSTMQEERMKRSYEEAIEVSYCKMPEYYSAVRGHSAISVNDFVNLQKGDK
jgi:hypothetical protein